VPVSKQSYKRKMKIRKRNLKREAWVRKKVAAFNALPDEDRQGLLRRWAKRDGPTAQLGGMTTPVDETIAKSEED
jgi:hypothetical protein